MLIKHQGLVWTIECYPAAELCDIGIVEAEVTADGEINLYPNPATDYIEIKTDKIIDVIEVFYVLGRGVISLTKPQGRIDVSHLQPGVYFVRVGSECLKFVKM